MTAALTGAVHIPSMSTHLPVTSDEIVAKGVRAARAGAAIPQVHARDPETGRPDQSPRPSPGSCRACGPGPAA